MALTKKKKCQATSNLIYISKENNGNFTKQQANEDLPTFLHASPVLLRKYL
jgi:hypothetical protein